MIVLDTPDDPAFSKAMRDILRRHNFGKPINPPQSGNTADLTNGKEDSNQKNGQPVPIPPRDNTGR